MMNTDYSLIVVGTGFASAFFLKRYLEKAPANARVLVLERGQKNSHDWQIKHRKNSDIPESDTYVNEGTLNQGQYQKNWKFTIGFGGGSNCWWACTPRMLPADFEMQTRYGVSQDWPITYDQLETYYQQAEHIMAIAGPSDRTPFPRSKPYPLPPHRLATVDKLLQKYYPDSYFVQPTARPSEHTPIRPKCCGNGICHLCPINSKFTLQTEFADVYGDSRVELLLNAEVDRLEIAGDKVAGVYYKDPVVPEKLHLVKADLVALGANAFFNPAIMLRSKIRDAVLGRYVNEQEAIYIEVDLDGIDNFDGGTSITGHNYHFYDGEHRKEHAACLIESYNVLDNLRVENGKWRQRIVFKAIFEELPQRINRVEINPKKSQLPIVHYKGPSDYVTKSIASLKQTFPEWLSVLPVEDVRFKPNTLHTEAHIQGSTRMGTDPETSVVDKDLVHHRYRNLLVMGSGVFPTCTPANPSLTISALSLRAADRLFGV